MAAEDRYKIVVRGGPQPATKEPPGPSPDLKLTEPRPSKPQISQPYKIVDKGTLPSKEEPGLASKIFGGALRGVREDPIAGFFVNQLIETFPEASQELIQEFQERAQNSSLSKAAELVGEYGPMFLMAGGAFSLGRTALVKGASLLGTRGMSATVEGVLAGTETGVLSKVAARNLKRYQQVAGVGGEDVLLARLATKPTIERALEIAGGSAGFGVYAGTEELFQGAPLSVAGRAALTNMVLAAGIESGLTVVGKGIRAAKQYSRERMNKAYEEAGIPKLWGKEKVGLENDVQELTHKINQLNGVGAQEIETALDGALVQGVKQVIKQDIKAVKQAELFPKVPKPKVLGPEQTKFGFMEGMERNLRPNAARDATIRKLELKILQKKADIQALENMMKDPLSSYTRGPSNPKTGRAIRDLMLRARLQAIQVPESLKGQMGRTMARFFQQWDQAEALTTMARSLHELHLKRDWKHMGKLLGMGRKEINEGTSFLPIFNAWEKYDVLGVRNFLKNEKGIAGPKADQIVKIFERLDDTMTKTYGRLEKLGVEPLQTTEDLRQRGVSKFLPHLLAELPDDEVLKILTKRFGHQRALELMESAQLEGLSKFGSIDFQRKLKGSLYEKILGTEGKPGMPFNANPWDAIFQYMNNVATRIHYSERFGYSGVRGVNVATKEFKGNIKDAIVRGAVKEGAPVGAVNTLVDLALGHKVYPQAMRQLGKVVTGLQTGSKLTLAVIPNASQSINTIMFLGVRNFGRGLMLATRGENRSTLLESVALAESVVTGIGRTFGEVHLGGLPAAQMAAGLDKKLAQAVNFSDKFAYSVLNFSQFNRVERWNRVLAAASGHYYMRSTISKAIHGRLKGRTLDTARRRMEAMGLNLDEVVRRARRHSTLDDFFKYAPEGEAHTWWQAQERLGMFKSSVQTQFNPNMLRRPIFWNDPRGRVLFQFKTFALGQTRFLRDQVLAEAAHGNLKPLAYFLSIYPMAGEAVGELKSLVRKGEPRDVDGVARLFNDYLSVGGFGLISDTLMNFRMGRGAESALGPTVGDLTRFVENFVQGDGEGILGQVTRMPLFVASRDLAIGAVGLGILTEDIVQKYLDTLDSEGEHEDTTIIDLGRLRTGR